MSDSRTDLMSALCALQDGTVSVGEPTEADPSAEVLVLGDGAWMEVWSDGRVLSVVVCRRDGRRWRAEAMVDRSSV